MEKTGSSSSSKFTSELFGSSIESHKSSSQSSSAGIFASMFPPPATANGIQQNDWGSKKGSPGMGQQEKCQPCPLSSSLYYGGRDIYSASSSTTSSAAPGSTAKQKGKEDDDPNGNNSQGASRGNWWQGSLYY